MSDRDSDGDSADGICLQDGCNLIGVGDWSEVDSE